MLRPLLAAAGAALLACLVYLLWLPDVGYYKNHNPKTTAYIELRRARLGPKFHPQMIWVGWNDISDNLKHAVFIAEDDTFYRHSGIDWDAVQTAFAKDWGAKRLAFGGSTITQQLARNLYLSPSKNPLRKLKEMLIARRLEKKLGKRRIFELYLNIAEWGKGIYGCEAASEAYFGKHASELSVDEAVALAVVLPSPRRHDPAKGGPYVARNSARVLARMRASHLLPEEQENAAEDLDTRFDVLASSPAALGAQQRGEQGERDH